MIVEGDYTCSGCLHGNCKACMANNGFLMYVDPDNKAGDLTRCNCHDAGHNEEARAWHAAGRLTRHDA